MHSLQQKGEIHWDSGTARRKQTIIGNFNIPYPFPFLMDTHCSQRVKTTEHSSCKAHLKNSLWFTQLSLCVTQPAGTLGEIHLINSPVLRTLKPCREQNAECAVFPLPHPLAGLENKREPAKKEEVNKNYSISQRWNYAADYTSLILVRCLHFFRHAL